jgi:hypothetical protein
MWLAAMASIGIAVTSSQTAIAKSGHNKADESVDLKLRLDGYIKPHCSINIPNKKLWFYIRDEAGQASIDFEVNCNQPLNVEVSSKNGGLKHTAFNRIPDYDGFSEFVPYELSLAVDAPDAKTLNFESEHIQVMPGGGSIGVIPYSANGTLDLSWLPEEPLIAGEFRDVIEIRVTGDGGANGHW